MRWAERKTKIKGKNKARCREERGSEGEGGTENKYKGIKASDGNSRL